MLLLCACLRRSPGKRKGVPFQAIATTPNLQHFINTVEVVPECVRPGVIHRFNQSIDRTIQTHRALVVIVACHVVPFNVLPPVSYRGLWNAFGCTRELKLRFIAENLRTRRIIFNYERRTYDKLVPATLIQFWRAAACVLRLKLLS